MSNEISFHLEGKFLGVCALDGYKLKYLRLGTEKQDFIIKIPKELRGGMVYKLSLGDRICCEGIQKDSKFKAYTIEKIGDRPEKPLPLFESFDNPLDRPSISTSQAQVQSSQLKESKVQILICQKSHCLKNGGREVYEALAAQIESENLSDMINLKSTGCLKCCKQAPNLVILPNSSKYNHVRISQIPQIMAQIKGINHTP